MELGQLLQRRARGHPQSPGVLPGVLTLLYPVPWVGTPPAPLLRPHSACGGNGGSQAGSCSGADRCVTAVSLYTAVGRGMVVVL